MSWSALAIVARRPSHSGIWTLASCGLVVLTRVCFDMNAGRGISESCLCC